MTQANFPFDPPIANGSIEPDPGHPNQMRADLPENNYI